MKDAKVLTLIEEKYGITQTPHPNPLFTLPGSLLQSDEGMEKLITTYMPLIKALEPAAAGAYIVGRLAALTAAMQYMLSMDELIDLSPDRWTLELYTHERGYFDFRFLLHELVPLAGPEARQREAWRKERLTVFYRDHIRPIVEAVSRSAGLGTIQLWGFLPMYMKYAIDEWVVGMKEASIRERITDDWHYLSKELDTDIFGRTRNPFNVKFRMVNYPGAPGEPDRQLRMKTACCCYYLTEGGDYCYTCPRLTAIEREQRKTAIRAELEAKTNGINE